MYIMFENRASNDLARMCVIVAMLDGIYVYSLLIAVCKVFVFELKHIVIKHDG